MRHQVTYGGLQWYALKTYLMEAAATVPPNVTGTGMSAAPPHSPGTIVGGPPFTVRGADWTAHVTHEPATRHGSIEIAQLTLTVEGAAEAIQRLMVFLHPRTMRGGG